MGRAKRGVFVNVPFDRRYKRMFEALIFAIHDCGFVARTALEQDDGSQVRVEKLYRIIGECGYGVHDLSRTTLDRRNRLPRFNMPLELGIYLGCKRFGGVRHRTKSCLILDSEPYRYQKFCSDIAGQDIRAHGNEAKRAILAVRNWLQSDGRSAVALPGPATIQNRYLRFQRALPRLASIAGLDASELTFLDYRTLVTAWISQEADEVRRAS